MGAAINGIMVATGIIAAISAIFVIATWIHEERIYFNKFVMAAIVFGTISIILPDKQTIYIAGLAYLTEQALVNPDIRDSIGLLRDRLLK